MMQPNESLMPKFPEARWAPPPRFWPSRFNAVGSFGASLLAVGLHSALGPREHDRFGILMYHRATPRVPGLPAPSINVTPRRMRDQLEGLQRRGYEFWPLRKALEWSRLGDPIPGRVVVVTFDDGFESVYLHAARVLRELRIPATIFVSTAFLDQSGPFPFDHWAQRYHVYAPPASYRPMTWAQCRELLEEPELFEIGAHTHTHQDFRGRATALFADLETNLMLLERELGIVQPSFAFPYGTPHLGFVDARLIAVAKSLGVTCGLTTASGLVASGTDPFTWARLNVFPWDTAATIEGRLAGWYSWAPQQRQRVKAWVRKVTGGSRKPALGDTVTTPAANAASPHALQRQVISVVVPTFNRSGWLSEALQSLVNQQTGDAFDYEIVVVDNASTDDTAAVVERVVADARVSIRYVHQTTPGDAPTRNAGIREARGQWLAFFDDDQLASAEWLYQLHAAAACTGAQIVGGPVLLDLPQEQRDRLDKTCRRALREIDYYDHLHPYVGKQLPGTGNALVARSVFDRLGLFNEAMNQGGSDSDFFRRAQQAGYEQWYAPRAIIRHRIAPQRLTREFLRWDCLSGGVGQAAYFDVREKGRIAMLARCVARLVQTACWHVPLYAWARLRRNEGAALGRCTLMWRNEGYARATLATLAPGWFPQTEFFESMDFRHGRTVAAESTPLSEPACTT